MDAIILSSSVLYIVTIAQGISPVKDNLPVNKLVQIINAIVEKW
jgi:hypothetical protein